uniref:PH domain-containing protein n=1 Tax=Bursaphelenchus xylophilus TaxID=6326 RepID=A0A1I7SB74_BURXY
MDQINLISPSLFSLHDEGEGIENLTSLPTLLKSFTSQDQQLWLDIIMEAAGVNEQSEKLEQDLYDMEINKTRSSMTNITNLVDENGTPLYATKDNATELGASPEYIAFFEQLQTNYTKEQLREMNTTGYTILKKNQIQMLYGPQSPHADDAVYNRLMNMTEKEIHDHLQKDFDMIAEMDNFQIDQSRFERSQHVSHSRRKKRLLPGVILSPVPCVNYI